MGYAFDWEEGRLAVRKEADTASGEEFPCVEPVEILFVNGDGQEVNVRIPEGRFEEAADEVEKKNWEFFADETVWVRIE